MRGERGEITRSVLELGREVVGGGRGAGWGMSSISSESSVSSLSWMIISGDCFGGGRDVVDCVVVAPRSLRISARLSVSPVKSKGFMIFRRSRRLVALSAGWSCS